MGKSNRKKSNNKEQIELTERQKNIIKIRKRMNRRELEQEKFHGFTKAKLWTYLWIFLFTPYGVYRLYDPKNEFLKQQKIAWSIVAAVYVVCYVYSMINL